MRKPNGYILLFLFTISFLNIRAQPELKFERYATDQGLVQNYVECVFQDDYGFMWFGTRNGISRFDGVSFKNYLHDDNDSCSMLLGWVQSIQAGDKNRLWIGSGGSGGLMSYNYRTDCFTKHKLYLSEESESQNENFPAILYDNKGILWTTLSNRLVIFNPDTKKTVLAPQNNEETVETFATFIYEDKKGFIWIGSGGKGLLRYSKHDSVYVSYKHNSGNSNTISSNSIRCIYEDSRGNIWIGTDNGGLNRYIPPLFSSQKKEQAHGSFEKFFHDPYNPNSLSHNTVYSICEDAENNLWIGTLNGLCLFDRDSKKFHTYYYDDRDSESLNDNIVRSLYCDKSGNLWIGTRLGVAKLKKNRFKTYNYSSYKNSLSHNKVDYLFVDEMQNIFVCTPVGIDYFDRKDNTFQVFKSIGKSEEHLSASPICMTSDHDNGYWIGTYSGGLYYYNVITKKCVTYAHNEYDSTSLGDNDVFSVCVDSENTIWIGNSHGVNEFDKNTGEFTHYFNDFESDNKVFCIHEDRDKNIWAGTARGLYLLDKDEMRFKYYSFNKRKDAARETLIISCLYQAGNMDLWIGTSTGLYKINTKTEKKTSYQLTDGLPSLRICSILEDKNHVIWISTKNGLAQFMSHVEKENKKKFKTYGKEDGLQSELIERSNCKLNDGTIAFGGSEGLSIFHPDSIKKDTMVPKIVFTNLNIFNKPVNIGEEVNGEVIINQSLLTTDIINIHHQNNNFTIGFAALHYRNPELNQYAYKLDGYDKEWNYTHAQNRHATYTDLPYKTYTFLLKASNSDGIWSKEIKKLTVHVLPPWWLTLWFKILAIIVIISSIIFWVKFKTYKLSKQKKILEERVEHRTRQLKEANQILEEGREELQLQAEQLASMNEKLMETNTNLEAKTIEVENMAKVVHEADQSKLRFFANISHEFRTPLSLIISPLEKLLSIEQPTNWNQIKNNYLQLMHRNAKRLFRLINEIIDFRKMDQGEKKLNITNNNIEEFIVELVGAFSAQAEQKNIGLKIEILKNTVQQLATDFWFDPDVMEKILYNLISNAIKYTPQGGNVSVQLSVNSEQSTENSNQLPDDEKLFILNSSLLIKVSDTGIGIKKENLERIFERFYRVDDTKESFAKDGAGIGLAYTKELIELHEGLISVESEVGKGSIFTLQLPIGKAPFEKHIISAKPTDVKLDYIRTMMETSEKGVPKTFEIIEENLNDEPGVKKATILLIEDNADLRKFIKEELEIHYNVLEAENGEKGWEKAFKFDPDIIVSDIMMPVMDGIALCKKIKNDENTSHIPIILLTAKTGDENTIEGLETGANDYITKPFDINILKIKINNLFLLQKKLKEKFHKSIDIIPSEITHSLIDEQFIQKAVEIVNENMQNYEFENNTFVSLMNNSRSVVYRKIKNITGQSVSEFIRSIRLKAAAKLFAEGNINVKDISYRVGFKHPSTFTTHFTKMFKKSPREFINEALKK